MFKYITKILCQNNLKNIVQMKKYTQKISNVNISQNIVWIDLELTGLNIETDRILEIACLVTDADLNIISNKAHFIIHQPTCILDSMDDWNTNHHGMSGLTDASKLSTFTESHVEQEIIKCIKLYTNKSQNPLAGNSIYMDRLFLIKHMPTLNQYLSYRIIDVSSIKELCKRWNVKVYNDTPKKRIAHRAISDIEESISELSYYKKHFFNI